MINFPANSRALHTIPVMPDSRPAAERTFGSVAGRSFGKKILERNPTKFTSNTVFYKLLKKLYCR